jgi:hypothetical protein
MLMLRQIEVIGATSLPHVLRIDLVRADLQGQIGGGRA